MWRKVDTPDPDIRTADPVCLFISVCDPCVPSLADYLSRYAIPPNLFTQLFTQGAPQPVFHAGKSLKATYVASHSEELLSDGRKNHRRKDTSKVMHLQSTSFLQYRQKN